MASALAPRRISGLSIVRSRSMSPSAVIAVAAIIKARIVRLFLWLVSATFSQLFSSSVRGIDLAQNIVVIKTLSGMANAVCAALDTIGNNSIVGTLAGDDTIFIACRENSSAQELADYLKQQKNVK